MNPEENTGPHQHPQEELVMLKWGTLKVNIDGELSIATAGSLIYLAAKETESMRYTGDVPATDYVIQWFTPAPPKH